MAVAGAMAMMASSSAGKEASKLQKEIDELKAVIAEFHKETDGTGPNTEDTTAGASSGATSGATSGSLAGTTSGSSGGATTAGGGSGLTMLPPGQEVGGSTTCLTASQEFSSDCSNPMTFSSPNLSMFGNQPDLQQVANQGVQMANDAARGNTGKANVAAASLSAAAARMNDALKKSVAKTNAALKAQGKKTIDFDKQKQDILNSMQSGFDKAIAGNQPAMAFASGSKLGLDELPKDKTGQNITAASTTQAIAVPTSNGKAQDAVDPSLNANAVVTADQKAPGESAATTLGNNLENYESAENDISKDSGESLWKQVSNRYLLNYDRFFDRKKVPAQ
jgi:hypothetical protein